MTSWIGNPIYWIVAAWLAGIGLTFAHSYTESLPGRDWHPGWYAAALVLSAAWPLGLVLVSGVWVGRRLMVAQWGGEDDGSTG